MIMKPKLSICISTLNRAAFIGETLESIVTQSLSDCEIVVSDNGSKDLTEQVVSEYASRCSKIRYLRHENDGGVDRNYDRAIEYSTGEYCWLLSDDDPLKPGAIEAILDALTDKDLSLVLVNSEIRDVGLVNVVQPRYYPIDSDRIYRPDEMDRLFAEFGPYLNFISGYVIRRAVWRERERERFYGSWFLFVGVVFQRPLPGRSLVLAQPWITCRLGNSHTFDSKYFELAAIHWPSLVWSLGISEATKSRIGREPWRSLSSLIMWRAMGAYSLLEYHRFIEPRLHSSVGRCIAVLVAVVPGSILNLLCILYCVVTKQRINAVLLSRSRFYNRRLRVTKAAVARG